MGTAAVNSIQVDEAHPWFSEAAQTRLVWHILLAKAPSWLSSSPALLAVPCSGPLGITSQTNRWFQALLPSTDFS